MLTFELDLRGLDPEQGDFVLKHLRDLWSYVTIRSVNSTNIEIEVSQSQYLFLALTCVGCVGVNGVIQCLAGMLDSECRRQNRRFMPNAQCGWQERIRPSCGDAEQLSVEESPYNRVETTQIALGALPRRPAG